MFIILVYDIKNKKSGKILKICRNYLTHIQKSVFEGNITGKNLCKLKNEIKEQIDCSQDAVCIYSFNSLAYSSKQQIGISLSSNNII